MLYASVTSSEIYIHALCKMIVYVADELEFTLLLNHGCVLIRLCVFENLDWPRSLTNFVKINKKN